jgi:putative transposase
MNLARSTYYYRMKFKDRILERERRDARLKELIDTVHVEYPYYGYRMLHHELDARGHLINEKRIRRIQRKFGLFATMVRKFVRTTDSKHQHRIYPNLLKNLPAPSKLNQVWVTDITYVKIQTSFVYVAVVMDKCSRKIIGYGISRRIDRKLTIAALQMAIEMRSPNVGCIHHSDRGVQYACVEYVELLNEWGFKISMSRKGNPYDNAAMESFMKTLKYNEVYLNHYEIYTDVVERIPEFIEEVYNKKRLHSAIGYLTPVVFENNINRKKTEADLNLKN